MLTVKGTAKAAWEAIKLQNQGSNHAATHVRLFRTEFETITFIEILLDPATMLVEEVVGHLRVLLSKKVIFRNGRYYSN
jgi:hypothetical protein